MSNKRKVQFEPYNIEILVDDGTNLLEAASSAGLYLVASCGGAGTCGTCKVQIKDGEVESKQTARISNKEYQQGIRQACQSRIISDIKVYIPVESILDKAVLNQKRSAVNIDIPKGALVAGGQFNPPFTKYYLEMPQPTATDNTSDLSRILRGLKQDYQLENLIVDFDILRSLPFVLRTSNWKTTVTLLVTELESANTFKHQLKLINIEPGNTTKKLYSLAFDIGTTTVKGQLLDIGKSTVLSEEIEHNGQAFYGADVISRITYCQKPDGLTKLQQAVVKTINEIITRLLNQSDVKVDDISHFVVAGNTTMTQILLGIDPKYIRLAPYIPAATHIPPVKANSLGIKVAEHVYLYSFPQVSSYVGGDIISGIVASQLHKTKKLTFYIDIGTNGEIVIGNSSWMVAAACSAGPAFEGGEIKHGMIAANGAIEDFEIDPKNLEPVIGTIGKEKPKGICGSGLINIVAGLLEAGVISQNGKFNMELGSKRIREGNDGYEFVLAWASETQIGKDIIITESDIDNLIRAKAAMYAGCQTLIKSVGLTCNDIQQVIIAGAFGNYINIEKAITIGLLPDLPRNRFIFIGNGSLIGARLLSFSTNTMKDVRKTARMITNFELSENTDFMNNYVAALFLPHTHTDEFASINQKLSGNSGLCAGGESII